MTNEKKSFSQKLLSGFCFYCGVVFCLSACWFGVVFVERLIGNGTLGFAHM